MTMEFVCARCKGELNGYRCEACSLEFPVLCGIPDFRLFADPYIGIAEDRAKGAALELSYAIRLRPGGSPLDLVAELNRIEGVSGVDVTREC